jgi:hypothetical protein
MREAAAQAAAHTNPIRESSSIAGLHRTVMQIIIISGRYIEDRE